MKFKYELQKLIETDLKYIDLDPINFVRKDKDPQHVERRKQQRAISKEMVNICRAYGIRKWIHGALTFTLTDKCLNNSPYSKLVNELRGLRVVCLTEAEDKLSILTVYWCTKIIKKKKPNKNYSEDYINERD